MKPQNWFEMSDIRKRWLAAAVWVPLRAANYFEKTGSYGTVGFIEEFYGVGSLADL